MTPAHSDRQLRIGIIAPPWVAVPPPAYGGTELVVDQLARGLQAHGHDVRLFTTGDATCPVRRSWLFPAALGTTAEPGVELEHVQQAYDEFADVDLVHDHTLAGPAWARSWLPDLPVVTTNHGLFTPAMITHFAAFAERVPIIAVSHSQRASAPNLPVAAVIHHGIDPDAFPAGAGDGGYLLFLGRMSPEKGVHRAIAIARASGRQLFIAAKMWQPDEHRYYSEVIEPLLGDDAVFLGQVTGQRKLDLLAGATALINPIQWPEPFGLVMIEALACGTPVLTFPEGAAPEIIVHGGTGFLCRDDDDMIARVHQVSNLDRRACRASVVSRFSATRFVNDHVAFYQQVLDRGRHRQLGRSG